MSRIVITNMETGDLIPLPKDGEIFAEGAIESRRVFNDVPGRPLQLWVHKLAPLARMRWINVSVGRVLYLWDGACVASGVPMTEGAVVIERRSGSELQAGEEGCTILEFHQRPELQDEAAGLGGHTHALTAKQVPRWRIPVGDVGVEMAIYADSDCPTCRFWLHENTFECTVPTPRHYHTSDEIIVCRRGPIMFGTAKLERGDVLAINARALYSFEAGANSSFINFRPMPSQQVDVDKTGHKPPLDELAMHVRRFTEPLNLLEPHVVAASLGQMHKGGDHA